jgi:hypothetical protein
MFAPHFALFLFIPLLRTSKSFFKQILFFLEQGCKLSSFWTCLSFVNRLCEHSGMCWHLLGFFFEVGIIPLWKLLSVLFLRETFFFSRSKNNEWFLEKATSDFLFWSLFLFLKLFFLRNVLDAFVSVLFSISGCQNECSSSHESV